MEEKTQKGPTKVNPSPADIHPHALHIQRYQGHHSGHSIATDHKSGSRPEGSQLQAVGNPLLLGESDGRKTSHQPPDYLPAAGRLQLTARCKSAGKLLTAFLV